MKTDDLIESLSRGVECRRVLSPLADLAIWLSVAFGSALVGVLWLCPRTDLWSLLSAPRYVIEAGLLFFLVVVAGSVSVFLAYPSMIPRKFSILAFASSAGGWIGVLGAFALTDASRGSLAPIGLGTACLSAIALVAALPTLVLIVLSRRAAPTFPSLNALAIGIVAFAAGALGLHFHCAVEGTLHRLAWHAVPVVAAGGFFAAFGWRILRW